MKVFEVEIMIRICACGATARDAEEVAIDAVLDGHADYEVGNASARAYALKEPGRYRNSIPYGDAENDLTVGEILAEVKP